MNSITSTTAAVIGATTHLQLRKVHEVQVTMCGNSEAKKNRPMN